jgi:hypothetical protein
LLLHTSTTGMVTLSRERLLQEDIFCFLFHTLHYKLLSFVKNIGCHLTNKMSATIWLLLVSLTSDRSFAVLILGICKLASMQFVILFISATKSFLTKLMKDTTLIKDKDLAYEIYLVSMQFYVKHNAMTWSGSIWLHACHLWNPQWWTMFWPFNKQPTFIFLQILSAF